MALSGRPAVERGVVRVAEEARESSVWEVPKNFTSAHGRCDAAKMSKNIYHKE